MQCISVHAVATLLNVTYLTTIRQNTYCIYIHNTLCNIQLTSDPDSTNNNACFVRSPVHCRSHLHDRKYYINTSFMSTLRERFAVELDFIVYLYRLVAIADLSSLIHVFLKFMNWKRFVASLHFKKGTFAISQINRMNLLQ